MPEVSIITPSYNASEFLEETIQSVIHQTFKDWEWLITDDQSRDNSVEIIRKFNDPRIRLTIAEKNLGAGQARNLSLEKATGRFITFLDSDDYWEPNFLEKMINFMKENHAELAYSNYARCNEKLEPVLQDFKADTVVTFDNLLKTCRLSLLSSMYDSKRVGKFYFPKGSKREDHVMWLNLLKEIPSGMPLPLTLSKYRMRDGSVSRRKKDIIKDQYLVYKKFMGFSTLKSVYYTAHWAWNGFMKYSKIFN
ncbi:MAG: glycosyltransferase family 2 protein [Cloacibacterium sp.]|jgi:glycosyltransferase involved in cell wall biosynthesis|nr:glycosyltransferase family 2 protein [Cloacibacterium sp.]